MGGARLKGLTPVSERPDGEVSTFTTQIRSFTPWPYGDRKLWGTTIRWADRPDPSVKLVIDEAGIVTYTDESGETGRWDPSIGRWVDPDTGEPMHDSFGVEGFELTSEEKEALADQLDAQVAEIAAALAADPGLAYTAPETVKTVEKLAERAAELHSQAAPLPPPNLGGET